MILSFFSRYLIIVTLFFSHSPLFAAEALHPSQQIIQSSSQALLEQLKNPDFAQDKQAVRQFVDHAIFPHIDTIRMSALVLGKHWRKASTTEKKQFIAAFKSLLVNTYATTFTQQFSNWSIRYLPLKFSKDAQKVTVKTIVSQSGKADARIDYSMLQRKQQWKIYDLKVEGISLVISNRETFTQMMKSAGSLAAVITQIEAKNQQ